jgi:N utilization substance protein B
MALSQQKSREILFQILFSLDFTQDEDDELNEFMMKEYFVSRRAIREIMEERRKIFSHLTDVDAKIVQYSNSYEFHRIPKVELNVLRLAMYEMIYNPSVPPKVSIAEAIRLTRKFSTQESASYVNAVLDALYKAEMKVKQEVGQEDELSVPVLST